MSQDLPSKRRKISAASNEHATTNDFYRNAAQWNLEQDYEQRSKKQKKKDKRGDKLPIKKGAVVEREQRFKDEPDAIESDREPSPTINETADASVDAIELPVEEPVDTRPLKVQIREAKEDIARIAASINEDPEEHVGQLKSLAKIASSKQASIKRVAMVAQLAVYKDIIPGYRIRPMTEEDAKAKVSKDVKRLRNFEQTLVSSYREYIHALGRATKANSANNEDNASQAAIATTAFTCICTLLGAVPHFNYRSELLAILVNKVAAKAYDEDSQRCVEAFEILFDNDEEGHTSLEAVTLLSKMFKSKDYNIHPVVLNTFLRLRLLSEYSHRASMNRVDKESDGQPAKVYIKKKHREFRTKRERKLLREQKSIQKEFKEADAIVGHEERDKHQSEILKMVFVAYFRILKQRKQSLMGTVLEGLARYAHLINQDFFGDILESLRDLVATLYQDESVEEAVDGAEQVSAGPTLRRDKSREMLLCTVTAFALLQGQDVAKSASSLHLDLSFFTKQLYNTVLPLALDAKVETTQSSIRLPLAAPSKPADESDAPEKKRKVDAQTPILLLLRSLTALLLPAQQVRLVPSSLLAAFIKRLTTASLHLPEKSALAVLALVRQVVKVHGAKVVGLWYSEERKGDGVFDMERDEWGSANTFATNIWEGELLRYHWSEKVKQAHKEVLEAVISRRG